MTREDKITVEEQYRRMEIAELLEEKPEELLQWYFCKLRNCETFPEEIEFKLELYIPLLRKQIPIETVKELLLMNVEELETAFENSQTLQLMRRDPFVIQKVLYEILKNRTTTFPHLFSDIYMERFKEPERYSKEEPERYSKEVADKNAEILHSALDTVSEETWEELCKEGIRIKRIDEKMNERHEILSTFREGGSPKRLWYENFIELVKIELWLDKLNPGRSDVLDTNTIAKKMGIEGGDPIIFTEDEREIADLFHEEK